MPRPTRKRRLSCLPGAEGVGLVRYRCAVDVDAQRVRHEDRKQLGDHLAVRELAAPVKVLFVGTGWGNVGGDGGSFTIAIILLVEIWLLSVREGGGGRGGYHKRIAYCQHFFITSQNQYPCGQGKTCAENRVGALGQPHFVFVRRVTLLDIVPHSAKKRKIFS